MAIGDFFRELFRKSEDEALEMEVVTGFMEGAYTVAEVRKILAGEIPLKFSDKEDIRLKNLRSGVAKGFRAGQKLRKVMEFQERLEKGEFPDEEATPDGRE